MTKLLAHYGVRDYRRASTRITAAIVDATDAARLDLALGRPVLVVDCTDVDADGMPLVTKRSRFAAERVEFWWRASLSVGSGTARRPMMAKRSLLEIQSIAATATRIIRIRNETFCHSSTRICSASCRPMPPAPTMPMMVAERVFEFDEIEHLPRDHRQHLRHQAKTDFVQRVAAGSADALDLLPVGGLDGFGEQFAERAEIRHRDRQHAGERTETDDIDPDQRPDQRVDAADRIRESGAPESGRNWTARYCAPPAG